MIVDSHIQRIVLVSEKTTVPQNVSHRPTICEGYVLAPLLFNIFFAVVINVASSRFKADKGIMDALVHLRKKREAAGWGGGGKQLSESQSWRRRFEACFILTMLGSSRNHQSS